MVNCQSKIFNSKFTLFQQEIAAALPKGGSNVGGSGQGVVQELRKLMSEVDDLKKERETLEEQFKATSMDMATKFLQALSSEGFIDCEKLSEAGLQENYGNLEREVDENIQQQESLVAKIQVRNTNSEFK